MLLGGELQVHITSFSFYRQQIMSKLLLYTRVDFVINNTSRTILQYISQTNTTTKKITIAISITDGHLFFHLLICGTCNFHIFYRLQ